MPASFSRRVLEFGYLDVTVLPVSGGYTCINTSVDEPVSCLALFPRTFDEGWLVPTFQILFFVALSVCDVLRTEGSSSCF